VKCSHCGAIFSADDFDNHECDLPLKECKRIEVVYHQDGSYKNKRLMTGWGIDGVLYTFEVVPRKPIPYFIKLSDGISQKKPSDEDFKEPRFSLFIVHIRGV
jgi:hypothetical protein